MDQETIKLKLIKLLNLLNEHTIKINSIIKEINLLSGQLKINTINFDPQIEQLNSTINSMKSKINIYSTEFKTNEVSEAASQYKPTPFIKLSSKDSKPLKIHIGFKNPYGEVHTFEAQYGTTMDKLLTTYLKTIGQNPMNNDLYFVYNGNNLYLGDYRKIEQIFSNLFEPTIIVKKYNSDQETDAVNQDNQAY